MDTEENKDFYFFNFEWLRTSHSKLTIDKNYQIQITKVGFEKKIHAKLVSVETDSYLITLRFKSTNPHKTLILVVNEFIDRPPKWFIYD